MPATIQPSNTVGQLVVDCPARSRVFEAIGIDYCCGGKLPLEEACRKRGVPVDTVLAMLAKTDPHTPADRHEDPAQMSLTTLADHIEATHHAWLRDELPRLRRLIEKVSSVHGNQEPRLHELRSTFAAMFEELMDHMLKEERILFPMVRHLEAGGPIESQCGSITNPIRQMEHEHDDAGDALAKMRCATDDFVPPEWACNTYRAMLDGLAELERDMHTHVHKENNILFPKAVKLETSRAM
ncbi:MAG: iron-sulfur cluster repair di-iron protein [Phycisphaerales bacterium]